MEITLATLDAIDILADIRDHGYPSHLSKRGVDRVENAISHLYRTA